MRCDVANAEELAGIVPAAVEAFGGLSLCVNCAGVARVVDFLSLERAEFERVLAINLPAPFQLGPEGGFGQRRAADIAQADEQHGGSGGHAQLPVTWSIDRGAARWFGMLANI